MASTTPKIGLRKPARTDFVSVVTDINDNMDILDDAVGKTIENLGDAYDNTKTYSTNDICIYNNTLYKANQDINTPEDFDPDHWDAATVAEAMKNAVGDVSVDYPFTIQTTDWSNTAPYTYTWTNAAIVAKVGVRVEFGTGADTNDVPYLEVAKVSGGVQFTAPNKPTKSIPIVVHVINAEAASITTISDDMVSSNVITGTANVEEAIVNLDNRVTTLNSNIAAHDGTFTKANNSYDVTYKISGNVHIVSFSAINNSGFSTGFVDIATLSDVTLPLSIFGSATDYTHDSFSYSRISSSNNKLQAYVASSGCKQVVGTCVFIV